MAEDTDERSRDERFAEVGDGEPLEVRGLPSMEVMENGFPKYVNLEAGVTAKYMAKALRGDLGTTADEVWAQLPRESRLEVAVGLREMEEWHDYVRDVLELPVLLPEAEGGDAEEEVAENAAEGDAEAPQEP